MTTQAVDRRLTSRNKLETRKDEVIGAFAQGVTWSQMIDLFGCSRAALAKFHDKYLDEIDQLRAAAAERVRDVVLTTKEGRIRELAWWYDQIKEEAVENGIVVVEERVIDGDGESSTTLKTRDFRGQMVKEARGILDDIAAELGERSPKDGGNGGTFVLIRERIIEHGGSLEPLG